jgi:hypothetical protein
VSDPETLAVLKSIDLSLRKLVVIAERKAEERVKAAQGKPDSSVASDRDLDGQYGDPEVKMKDPRDWTGEPQQGKRFSECPAEYLDLFADRLDYFAGKNAESDDEADRKKARYQKLDAARARGWALRIRAGYKPAPGGPAWAGEPDGI